MTDTGEPSSVAATDNSHSEAASAHAETIPLKEAAEIVRTYTALLPFPKDQITSAAISLMLVATDLAEKESFVEVAKTLAFFQPDVGNTPISLDEIRSDEVVWRSIVEGDMQNIELLFFEAQR